MGYDCVMQFAYQMFAFIIPHGTAKLHDGDGENNGGGCPNIDVLHTTGGLERTLRVVAMCAHLPFMCVLWFLVI